MNAQSLDNESMDHTIDAPASAHSFLFGTHSVQALARAMDSEQVLDRLATRVKAPARELWSAAHRELASVASEFLEVDLGELAVAGWRRHRELQQAARRTRDGSCTALVRLGGRDIILDQHPRVDVMWGNVTLTVVKFELRIDIKVLQLTGHVRGGCLVALDGGPCEIAAAFKAAGVTLAARRARFDPKAVIQLGTGIPLIPGQRTAGRFLRRSAGR
jgi:hypothetical protein